MKRVIALLLGIYSNTVFSTVHLPAQLLDNIKGQAHEGQQIVDHYCAMCHAPHPQIEMGAPRIHEKNDWQLRIKSGWDMLLKHTYEGFNAMPPRGGCFECTDEQLQLAISALLPQAEVSGFIQHLHHSNMPSSKTK